MGVATGPLAWLLLAVVPAATGAGSNGGSGTAGAPCGPNPGSQLVTRADGSGYPYFGMPCTKPDGSPDSACGDCFLDGTCTCAKKCCVAREGPPGYACQANGTDLVGSVCVAKDVGKGKTLAELADACDAMYHAAAGSGIGCAGFNTDGFLKKCVRSSCGATPSVSGGPTLLSCYRTNTPVEQPHPKGELSFKPMNFAFKNDEFCIKNDEFCIKNDEFCI